MAKTAVVDGSTASRAPGRRALGAARGVACRYFADLAPGLAEPGDILITKSTWGAFFRTDLDAELKSRGIRTIVLGGVATHVGVDTTARQAWELGYELVVARDATTSGAIEPHEATMRHIFPRIARVTDGDALAFRD